MALCSSRQCNAACAALTQQRAGCPKTQYMKLHELRMLSVQSNCSHNGALAQLANVYAKHVLTLVLLYMATTASTCQSRAGDTACL
eukprot:7973-Heterococcus_DN1.PRE.6